jgi:TM2 domain-containing membrane protein YozV
MKGSIVVVDTVYQQSGFISGADGHRYTFSNHDWKGSVTPYNGMDVDFIPDGEFAKEIYPLKNYGNNPQIADAKQKIIFILLGIFLGTFGIHNFYAGYIGKGVAQLLITILSVGFLAIISWIWAIIEIVTITKDSKGVPMV